MRIIAGRSKGRVLETIKGINTRPTSDRVKESMFSIIQGNIEGSVVLDLFAGTGNLGLEALSRGASKAVFIDKDIKAIQAIKRNSQNLGYEAQSEVYRNDARRALTELRKRDIVFNIIFIDPPYMKCYEETLLSLIDDLDILHREGIIIMEHDIKTSLSQRVANLHCYDKRKYGGTGLSLYRKE